MISTDGERGESNSELGESGTWVTCANLANAGVPPSAPEPIAGETVEQVTQVPDSPNSDLVGVCVFRSVCNTNRRVVGHLHVWCMDGEIVGHLIAQANLANAGVPPSAPEPIAGETVEQVTQVPDSR
jgi:hypothetical protein